jgi:hypothetical protein
LKSAFTDALWLPAGEEEDALAAGPAEQAIRAPTLAAAAVSAIAILRV